MDDLLVTVVLGLEGNREWLGRTYAWERRMRPSNVVRPEKRPIVIAELVCVSMGQRSVLRYSGEDEEALSG